MPLAFVISLGWLARDSWSVEIKFASKLLVEYLILCAVGSQQCAQSPDLRIHKRNKNMTRNQQVPTLIILWKFSDKAWFQRIFIQNFYSIVTKFHGFGLLCSSLLRCPSFENHVYYENMQWTLWRLDNQEGPLRDRYMMVEVQCSSPFASTLHSPTFEHKMVEAQNFSNLAFCQRWELNRLKMEILQKNTKQKPTFYLASLGQVRIWLPRELESRYSRSFPPAQGNIAKRHQFLSKSKIWDISSCIKKVI